MQSRSLFETGKEHLTLQDGSWLSVSRGFLTDRELFATLRETLKWEVSVITVFGKQHPIPRMNAWYGDSNAVMRYSGKRFEPHALTKELHALRLDLQQAADAPFNSVLANLYRSGEDGMGWHSDDEVELGQNPLIASLSLGATRKFVLKHKRTKAKQELFLHHGDLLIMGGQTQQHYVHALPKTKKPCDERINLTFRQVALEGL